MFDNCYYYKYNYSYLFQNKKNAMPVNPQIQVEMKFIPVKW